MVWPEEQNRKHPVIVGPQPDCVTRRPKSETPGPQNQWTATLGPTAATNPHSRPTWWFNSGQAMVQVTKTLGSLP